MLRKILLLCDIFGLRCAHGDILCLKACPSRGHLPKATTHSRATLCECASVCLDLFGKNVTFAVRRVIGGASSFAVWSEGDSGGKSHVRGDPFSADFSRPTLLISGVRLSAGDRGMPIGSSQRQGARFGVVARVKSRWGEGLRTKRRVPVTRTVPTMITNARYRRVCVMKLAVSSQSQRDSSLTKFRFATCRVLAKIGCVWMRHRWAMSTV